MENGPVPATSSVYSASGGGQRPSSLRTPGIPPQYSHGSGLSAPGGAARPAFRTRWSGGPGCRDEDGLADAGSSSMSMSGAKASRVMGDRPRRASRPSRRPRTLDGTGAIPSAASRPRRASCGRGRSGAFVLAVPLGVVPLPHGLSICQAFPVHVLRGRVYLLLITTHSIHHRLDFIQNCEELPSDSGRSAAPHSGFWPSVYSSRNLFIAATVLAGSLSMPSMWVT